VLAGFDLKFAADLGERLNRRTDLELEIDDWPALAQQTDHTLARLERAQSIFAEWARTSAVWLSKRKRPDQFLAVRLHRFELDAPYPREMDIADIDAVVYIAPLFGRRIRDELGWPVEKLVYIPNFLEVDWFDRPKLPGAQFTLGFVGLEFIRKRFDLALDLLSEVRRSDPRFTMVVRGVMPWDNKYAWQNPEEREYVGWCFERIERDPLLRNAVTFHSPGRDMARWFRRLGFIVSTSDEEGSHASVAEGMASGAVPVVRPWPGAAEIYDKEWVHGSTSEAAAAVLASADPVVWAERSARAQREIRRSHNPTAVVEAWADLLHRDVAGARRYFAEFSPL
jgi:glycosyltransferase involved in cell wall biosynthesis